MPRKLDVFDDETFKSSGVPFYAVVTALETGEPEYMEIKSVFEDMDKLRASGSMPFVSRPVEIDGKLYLDGGVADSVPYEAMKKLGYDRLAVILTRDMDYRKKPMPALPIKLCFRHYPQFRDRLLKRHETYNSSVARLRELEERGEIFVIRPSEPIEIGRVESGPGEAAAGVRAGAERRGGRGGEAGAVSRRLRQEQRIIKKAKPGLCPGLAFLWSEIRLSLFTLPCG